MNIASLLSEQPATRPVAVAMIGRHGSDADRRTTFAELEQLGAAAGASLSAAGIGKGDVVIVLVPMSAELYATLLGLWRLGAVAMLVDPSADEMRIAECCATVRPKGIVLSAKAHLLLVRSSTLRSLRPRFSTSAVVVPGSRALFAVDGSSSAPPIASTESDDLALVTFTSGSTGAPKAAGRTHGFLLAQHAVLARTLGLTLGEVDLTTLPIFVLANLASGVTSVVPAADMRRVGAIDPRPVIEQIERLGVTRTVASPAFLLRLVEECERGGRRLSGLRSIHTGGAPVFPSLLRRLAAVAPAARVVAVYGSTEAEPIAEQEWSATKPDDLARTHRGGGLLAGTPVDETKVRTVGPLTWNLGAGPFTSEQFEAIRTGCGVPGEIIVTGEHVLKGYLDPNRDAETKIRVGAEIWHRTGDLGEFDGQGRLWLLGRAGTAVQGLYPLGVEAALDDTPGLVRCALAEDAKGHAMLAVQSDGSLEIEALRVRARELGVASLRVMPEIPVDARHNAKVDYPKLREMLRD